tara:strand:+ start:443 stop:1636 length:1194 start_codon:yes stop_codon:yes gene_type:complete
MAIFKFNENDIFINTIESYPQYKFYVQSGNVFIDDMPHMSGANTDHITGVPKGFVSLYEYNIDRPYQAGSSTKRDNIYPFLIKGAQRIAFKTNTASDHGTQFLYGEIMTGSYNMSASINRELITSTSRSKIIALRNTLDHYQILSPHYQYSSSLGNKATQNINLISIPHILRGTKIKKGSMRLRYYLSGTLIGELQDENYNGELVQVGPSGSTGSGSVAGVVLYSEGVILLTGSWDLNHETLQFLPTASKSKWLYFAYGANDNNYNGSKTVAADTSLSASFLMEYSGTTNTQTMTMFAHANYRDLNYSNNPTFVSASEICTWCVSTGSNFYHEMPKKIKNITFSPYLDEEPLFQRTVYISKIGIYDKDKNLIGVAKTATPIRKTEKNQYTFKLKLDI